MSDTENQVRRLARVLSAISHTLESSDERQKRVERCLALTREIIPCCRAALFEYHDDVMSLYVAPPEDVDGRDDLHERLSALYRLVTHGDEIGRTSDAKPSLALPVMGLDETIGVIRVEPDGVEFDARHLRLLAVVAAQLGAYLAMVRLRERDAARAKEIESAHDYQRLLAGVVGHDLRNPLAVIMAVASSILETTTDPKLARKLEQALRNAEHATRLITDLVDVTESRVTGIIRVNPHDGNFREVVTKTVDDLREAHKTRTIELVVAEDEAFDGCFDATRVSQIVTNLVTNAVVHGDARMPIRVRLYVDDGHVHISVRNWGAAIAASLLPNIFDPFKQGASAVRSRDVHGLGLGLYIVDCLTRGHGGRVNVESDTERGTVFRVRLPRRADPAASTSRMTRVDRPTVMVVDDDEDIRIGLSGVLEKHGYEVATAFDGLDALQQLRAGLRPRLIFLDFAMPVMNGEEFCDECGRDPELASIPIVVVSADAAAALRVAQARGSAVLSKPVSVDKLLATLSSIGDSTKP